MADMPQRAFSYLRFSHPSQAKGDSVRRQIEWAERICREKGWRLDDALQFADRGKSAFHGGLKALAAFRDLVKRGRIAPRSVLIVEVLDRLSREQVDEAYDIFREILRSGVWICTREPERIYTRETSGNMLNLLEPLFIFARAHEESAAKSMRVGDAWMAQRRRAHESGALTQARPPAWVRRVDDRWRLLPNAVQLVRRIAELARAGHGTGEIAARLNAEGKTSLTRCGHWTGSAVHQLLTSRTLIGEYQPGRRLAGKRVPDGPPIPNYYPAALSTDEWDDTRAALASRRRRSGRPAQAGANILRGLVWDAGSRRRMSLQTVGSHGARIRYCSIGQVSGCARVRFDDLEALVLDAIDLLKPSDVLEPEAALDEREKRVAELTRLVTALNHRYEQLQADAADPTKDYLPAVLDRVAAELKQAAAERDRLQLETRSGRAEALTDSQTLRQLRDSAQSAEERAAIERRLAAALPAVISSVWLQTQRISPRRQVVHVQLWLRGGACRYVQHVPDDINGRPIWDLAGFDLRRGPFRPQPEETHVATLA